MRPTHDVAERSTSVLLILQEKNRRWVCGSKMSASILPVACEYVNHDFDNEGSAPPTPQPTPGMAIDEKLIAV